MEASAVHPTARSCATERSNCLQIDAETSRRGKTSLFLLFVASVHASLRVFYFDQGRHDIDTHGRIRHSFLGILQHLLRSGHIHFAALSARSPSTRTTLLSVSTKPPLIAITCFVPSGAT